MIPHEVTGARPSGVRGWVHRLARRYLPATEQHLHLHAFVSVIREQGLREGDLLIVRVPGQLSKEQFRAIREELAVVLDGVNAKVAVMSDNVQAEVLHMHERDMTTAALLEELRTFRDEWRRASYGSRLDKKAGR